MKNKICELVGIKYPIFQGGMAWVADHKIAAAVSQAGGLGIIAGGAAPAEVIRNEIRLLREITDKPFGVNVMLMSPTAAEIAQMVCEEKVNVVTTGAGSPGKYIDAWKEAGIKVIPVVPSVALARRVEKQGADAVIIEGTESGGHVGEMTTMAATPQVVDAVSIPVIAAGGIADGRGIAAAFMLGADGVQVGTRFLASVECNIADEYKNLVVNAKDTDTAVTGRSAGAPVRCIKTQITRKLMQMEKDGATFEEMEGLTVGSLRKAVKEGDLESGSFMAGQISGLVKEIKPVKEIIEEIFTQTEEILKKEIALY